MASIGAGGGADRDADRYTDRYTDRAKTLAKLLRQDLAAAGFDIPHSLALELIAHQVGAKDWNVLAALAGRTGLGGVDAGKTASDKTASDRTASGKATPPAIGAGVPVLRVLSVAAALPFYLDYLGFTLDWEHRFEPGLPLYVQVSRSHAVLHLSEHHGDGSPNGVVWLPVADVFSLHAELRARPDAPIRPGVDLDAPGGPTLRVIDPYGNVLRFAQPQAE